jgi:hypothetical protein
MLLDHREDMQQRVGVEDMIRVPQRNQPTQYQWCVLL